MSVEDIVERFKEAGGRIVDGRGRLVLKAPRNVDPRLKKELISHKAEIREFLKVTHSAGDKSSLPDNQAQSFEYWEEMSLKKLEKHDVALRIESKLVDGPIWLVSNEKARRKLGEPRVVYTAKEVMMILDLPTDLVKQIHRFKAHLDAEVEGVERTEFSKNRLP